METNSCLSKVIIIVIIIIIKAFFAFIAILEATIVAATIFEVSKFNWFTAKANFAEYFAKAGSIIVVRIVLPILNLPC